MFCQKIMNPWKSHEFYDFVFYVFGTICMIFGYDRLSRSQHINSIMSENIFVVLKDLCGGLLLFKTKRPPGRTFHFKRPLWRSFVLEKTSLEDLSPLWRPLGLHRGLFKNRIVLPGGLNPPGRSFGRSG
jgi:hypothetical protein